MSEITYQLPTGDILLLQSGTTFCVGVIGSGPVSRCIQKNSDSVVSGPDRWSHVAALGLDTDGRSYVWESHFKSGGIVKLNFETWLQDNKKKGKVEVFEYKLDLKCLNLMASLRIPYGTKDIGGLFLDSKFGWGNIKDSFGVVCSEYLAHCDAGKILEFKEKNRPDQIKPTDFKEYAVAEGIPLIDITGMVKKK